MAKRVGKLPPTAFPSAPPTGFAHKCELMITVSGDPPQELGGTITLDADGKITGYPVRCHRFLVPNIMEESVFSEAQDRKITIQDDPVEWFNNLWQLAHGTYVRAYYDDECFSDRAGKAKRVDAPKKTPAPRKKVPKRRN